MGLDNIQLPPSVLQSLYNKSLYDLNTNKPEANSAQSTNIVFLGNNAKKIIILANSTATIYLPDEDLNFLLGILSACKLSMADVALINMAKNGAVQYKDISDQLNAEKIILFGIEPEIIGLPLQFPHYQIQQFNNQVYLSSVSLTKLMADKEEKLKLWNCLKKIFSLK